MVKCTRKKTSKVHDGPQKVNDHGSAKGLLPSYLKKQQLVFCGWCIVFGCSCSDCGHGNSCAAAAFAIVVRDVSTRHRTNNYHHHQHHRGGATQSVVDISVEAQRLFFKTHVQYTTWYKNISIRRPRSTNIQVYSTRVIIKMFIHSQTNDLCQDASCHYIIL